MCNFISGIVFGPKLENKYGFFYSDVENTNHHSDMEEALGLKDRFDDPNWAKVEFTPPNNNVFAPFNEWIFTLDENRTPSWWTDEHREGFISYIKKMAEPLFVRSGTIINVHNGNVLYVEAGGTVTRNYGTVTENYGTVTENYGTVTENCGTVTRNYGTVTRNHGTVTRNHGTVTRNHGTVTENCGTVTGNFGTVTENCGTVVSVSPSSIVTNTSSGVIITRLHNQTPTCKIG